MVTALEKMTIPIQVESDGYTFNYWYDMETDERVDFSKAITKDTFLRANWTTLEYDITYVLTLPQGLGTATFTQSAKYQTISTKDILGNVDLPLESELEGIPSKLYFKGWSLSEGGDTFTTFTSTSTNFKTLTFYAVFELRSIQVIVDLNSEVDGEYIEFTDYFDVMQYFENGFTCNETTHIAKKSLANETDVIVLPDVYDLYVKGGNQWVTRWYIADSTGKTELADLGLFPNLRHSNLIQHADSDNKVYIFAEFEDSSLSLDDVRANDSTIHGQDTYTISSDCTKQYNSYLFVANYGGGYTLFHAGKGLNKSIPALEFEIGDYYLVYVWIGEGFSGTVDSYDDLLGLRKHKKELGLHVYPGTMTIPTNTSASLVYNGTAQQITIEDLEFDSRFVTITSESGTDVGTYNYTASLKYPTHVQWEMNNKEDKVYTWTITAKRLYAYETPNTSIYRTYNGSEQSITPRELYATDVILKENEYEASGTWSATDAGDYEVYIRLLTNNYTFGEDKTYNFIWHIDKAELHLVYDDGEQIAEYDYNGETRTIGIASLFTEDITLPATEYQVTGTWSSVNAGEFTITIELTKNYEVWGETVITYTWVINKIEVALPITHGASGNYVTWDLARVGETIITLQNMMASSDIEKYGNMLTITGDTTMGDAGAKTAYLVLKDKVNTKWKPSGIINFPLGGGLIGGSGPSSNPLGGEDGTEDIAYNWTILPKSITMPQVYYINEYEDRVDIDLNTADYFREEIYVDCSWEYHTGTERRMQVYIPSASADFITVAGTTWAINAGDYTFTIALTHAGNTRWYNEQEDRYFTADKCLTTITWRVCRVWLDTTPNPEVVNGVLVPNFTNIMAGDTIYYMLIETGMGMDSIGGGHFSTEIPQLKEGENRIEYKIVRANTNYDDAEGVMTVTYTPPAPEQGGSGSSGAGGSNSGNSGSSQSGTAPNKEDKKPNEGGFLSNIFGGGGEEGEANNNGIIMIIAVGAVIAIGLVSIIVIIKKKKRK